MPKKLTKKQEKNIRIYSNVFKGSILLVLLIMLFYSGKGLVEFMNYFDAEYVQVFLIMVWSGAVLKWADWFVDINKIFKGEKNE